MDDPGARFDFLVPEDASFNKYRGYLHVGGV